LELGVTEPSLPDLEQQRARLYGLLAATGDFRPGSINLTYRRCGKPNCACARPGHRGHGPRWLWTRSAGGRTRTRQLAPAEREKARAELASYKQFAELSEQIVEVHEAICEARPVTPSAGESPAGAAGLGGLRAGIAAEAVAEVERLAALASRSLGTGDGLEAVELAIRTAMTALGGRLLEDLLAADDGYRGTRAGCGAGHEAEFVSCRAKTIDTVLGPVRLHRAWYHCTACEHGVSPKDAELGIEGGSMSPGLAKMTARAATAVPFAKAASLLAELAGVDLTVKRVERSAEASGTAAAEALDARTDAICARQVVPLPPPEPTPDMLYIAVYAA
jgi:Family of unknown function (DUF6788)